MMYDLSRSVIHDNTQALRELVDLVGDMKTILTEQKR